MNFPKVLTRTTKHKPPRHQIYQPGFNIHNSCWLLGTWVTVPGENWALRTVAHEALYHDMRARTAKQHHRDPPTALPDLTPAQRQAYEFYSGTELLECQYANGQVGHVSADMAGDRIDAQAIRWLRENNCKVLRNVKSGDGILDQSIFGVPEDLLTAGEEVVDTRAHVVKQNQQRWRDMFDAMLEAAGEGDADETVFAVMMALQALIETEESILRDEHAELQGTPNLRHDVTAGRLECTRKRKALKEKLGDAFEQHYEQARAGHNECARANLDNSDGRLFCYVLPKFNDDGTHEPWGERDVPWNANQGAKAA
jgi:hypothetical protein